MPRTATIEATIAVIRIIMTLGTATVMAIVVMVKRVTRPIGV